jgi:hypothetical protein
MLGEKLEVEVAGADIEPDAIAWVVSLVSYGLGFERCVVRKVKSDVLYWGGGLLVRLCGCWVLGQRKIWLSTTR